MWVSGTQVIVHHAPVHLEHDAHGGEHEGYAEGLAVHEAFEGCVAARLVVVDDEREEAGDKDGKGDNSGRVEEVVGFGLAGLRRLRFDGRDRHGGIFPVFIGGGGTAVLGIGVRVIGVEPCVRVSHNAIVHGSVSVLEMAQTVSVTLQLRLQGSGIEAISIQLAELINQGRVLEKGCDASDT